MTEDMPDRMPEPENMSAGFSWDARSSDNMPDRRPQRMSKPQYLRKVNARINAGISDGMSKRNAIRLECQKMSQAEGHTN